MDQNVVFLSKRGAPRNRIVEVAKWTFRGGGHTVDCSPDFTLGAAVHADNTVKQFNVATGHFNRFGQAGAGGKHVAITDNAEPASTKILVRSADGRIAETGVDGIAGNRNTTIDDDGECGGALGVVHTTDVQFTGTGFAEAVKSDHDGAGRAVRSIASALFWHGQLKLAVAVIIAVTDVERQWRTVFRVCITLER